MATSTEGKAKEKKSTVETDDEKDTNTATKEKLAVEIRALKLLITQTECKLNLTRFGDLRWDESIATPETSMPVLPELADVDADLQNELCSYAGFCCKKIDDKFVVAFQSLHANWYTNENWVELSKNQEGWKLGQWVMPLGVNVKTIFDKYSMSTSADMKFFLKDCKHHIDCHNRREQEFKRLEAFMSHMERYGCSLEANFGYTNVTMKLITKKLDASSNDTQKIIVYLLSNCDNARTSRIFIDCEGENELSRERRKNFSKMFNCFKDLDMVDAAKHVLTSPDSLFIWKDPSNDDSIVETNVDEGIDMDTSFSRLLQKKSKVAKKRRVVKSETVDENSNDTREKDLSDDVSDVSDGEVDDVDASHVDRRRSTKLKLETPKKAVPAKTKSGLSKITASAKTNDRGNIPAAKISDRPKTLRAPGREYFPLKDCNQNIINSPLKNVPSETADEPANSNDNAKLATPKLVTPKLATPRLVTPKLATPKLVTPKLVIPKLVTPKLATPKFFKSKHRRADNASPAGDKKSSEKRKNTDVEDFESKLKKSRANGVGSISTLGDRPANTLQCSTPLTECISILSTIGKENISAIAKVNTINPRRAIDVEQIQTVNLCESVNVETDDSDETDLSEVCNDHEALLKDLQAVKYVNNENATGKAATKSTKQKNIKVPLRGRNKFFKK